MIPVEWLFEENVPLIAFLIALLTHPATWAGRVLSVLRTAGPLPEKKSE
ncbi:hypothetical protein M1M38_gp034 [Halorubrum tailed virus 27]|uniref:Uncharacterized protein n=1 Tax=Halorubrum tailed virus 27 TaxID=2878008 RepID=A0AAE8XXY8_9CAUD|nr:hypothetical protein M1M38_gp034 [Halorubrum tailed virus 27]UBF22727.1 hypothetical protein HRTV-27_gp34 [Halorubrum tailed virus 27]